VRLGEEVQRLGAARRRGARRGGWKGARATRETLLTTRS
jgi:hypothetical protein